MAKQFYVESEELERDWFQWVVAKSTPQFEPFRQSGLLWTRVIGKVVDDNGTVITKGGKEFLNPYHPIREHCLNAGVPIYFTSRNGEASWPNPLEMSYDEQLQRVGMPTKTFDPGDGFVREIPTKIAWIAMLDKMSKICAGISRKFVLRSEDDRHDLSQEALIQVMGKLRRDRLKYIPGKASVFNLLTTTIHRCMYSILNRTSKQHNNHVKLIDDMANGALPATHSLCLFTNRGVKANKIKA